MIKMISIKKLVLFWLCILCLGVACSLVLANPELFKKPDSGFIIVSYDEKPVSFDYDHEENVYSYKGLEIINFEYKNKTGIVLTTKKQLKTSALGELN